MDKRTLLAFVLIGLVFMAWSFFFTPAAPEPSAARPDTTAVAGDTQSAPRPVPSAPAVVVPERFRALTAGANRYITIDAPKYRAILNSRGGTLARFELKEYKTWYGAPVQLISDSVDFPGVLSIEYSTPAGERVSTAGMNYSIDGADSVSIGENDSVVVTMRLALAGAAAAAADSRLDTSAGASPTVGADTAAPSSPAPAGVITKRFVFRGDSYGVGLQVAMENVAGEMARGYWLTWNQGLKYQEHNSVDESTKARALVAANDELETVDASSPDEMVRDTTAGAIEWVGVTGKYFAGAIIPAQPLKGSSAIIAGNAARADSNGLVESYDIALLVPLTRTTEARDFTILVGPLEYGVTRQYGVQELVDLGWDLIVRPIGEYLMLPFFRLLHSFISNFGVVIIVFSVVIRALLWPLSIPQIKSSRKMQLLQPRIGEIREQYKDDQQKQQMETMKVYREYGINPVGGCLPLILQLPILYALWATLSSAIDIRQEPFMLWIQDLSIPDVLFNLPFSVPLLGSHLSGLALFMGATLFIQQKQMITDPKQKALVYMMPVMLTLMFNNLPSGLNLYYFTFNLLSIGQQIYMTKLSRNPMTLEDMKRDAAGKKKGWLSQKLEEAQKMAEMQQRTAGGKGTSGGRVEGRTPVEPKRRK